MKKHFTILLLLIFSGNTWAVKLSDYKPFIFEALFTNPECATYKYDRPQTTHSGHTVTSKPDDVYCKQSDEVQTVKRHSSPQYRLVEWISHKETKELYLAYLSFSSKNVAKALCDAARRGVSIKLILDHGEDARNPRLNKEAEALKKCSDKNLVEVTYRGSTGGLGFAHNKIMIVNPHEKVVKLVFSSGNLSTGTSINHENWNFVTTAGESYFIQSHKCVVEGMIEAGDSKRNFRNFLENCRSKIKTKPETDIQTFFAPVEGSAALKKIREAGHEATRIEAMSHRFSGALAKLFQELLASGKKIRFILDDDIYWSAELKQDIGRNTKFEAFKLYNDLINKGMETKFLQTNQNIYQLQHNKFMIFHTQGEDAVFTGAGNFTTSAFTKNFENFYYITIPEVVEVYKKQYRKYFDEMATSKEDMPRDYVLP